MENLPTKQPEISAGVHNLEDVMMSEETMERVMGGGVYESMMEETNEAENSLSPFKN